MRNKTAYTDVFKAALLLSKSMHRKISAFVTYPEANTTHRIFTEIIIFEAINVTKELILLDEMAKFWTIHKHHRCSLVNVDEKQFGLTHEHYAS